MTSRKKAKKADKGKAKASKSKAVAVVEKKVDKAHTPYNMIEKARESFGKMQQSWWEFAKAIHEIRSVEAYTREALGENGFDSFKEFCEHEFPSTDYNTIIKLCTVIERMGGMIETKLQKEEGYMIPSYHSCYTVATVKEEEVSKKEELSKLRKAVLENKIGFLKLRERLKELIKTKRRALHEEVETDVSELEKDLSRELEDEGIMEIAEEEFEPGEIYEDDEAGDEDIEESSPAGHLSSLTTRIDYLIENVPDLTAALTTKLADDEGVIDFATKCEKLVAVIEQYLTKMEEVTE
jgi:hypothetical protein